MKLNFAAVFASVFLVNAVVADNHATAPLGYGQVMSISASDPGAVVEALGTFRSSAVGKKSPSNLTLLQVMAGGQEGVTHSIAVFYPTAANIDAAYANNAGTPEFAAAGAAIRAASDRISSGMYSLLRQNAPEGAVTSENPVSWLYLLEVTDQDAFMTAFDEIWESTIDAFPGNVGFGQTLVNGESPATHFVSFQANDMATLLNGVQSVLSSPAGLEYRAKAPGFRKIVAERVSRRVGYWQGVTN